MSELVLTTPKESAKAAQAFSDYVNLGPKRSLRKLCEAYGRTPSYVSQLLRWSTAYGWQDRLKTMAADQLATASNLKTDTYVQIVGEYHRRVSDDPRRQSMDLATLHGIYDRVKPPEPKPVDEPLPSATITFAIVLTPARAGDT